MCIWDENREKERWYIAASVPVFVYACFCRKEKQSSQGQDAAVADG